jgi:hypothetical protein
MQVGDIVQEIAGSMLESRFGTIVEVELWTDSGAPDRNFGVHIHVMWPDGEIETLEEDELRLVNESQ